MNPAMRTASARVVLTLALSIGAAASAPAQDAAAPAERPVSFAADQAARGETKYLKECEECHGEDLKGGLNGGASLRGSAFEEKWADGMQASVLFSYLSTAMPPNSPGRFSEKTYTDLMAYILMRNGFPEGEPLPSDIDALDYLIMEK